MKRPRSVKSGDGHLSSQFLTARLTILVRLIQLGHEALLDALQVSVISLVSPPDDERVKPGTDGLHIANLDAIARTGIVWYVVKGGSSCLLNLPYLDMRCGLFFWEPRLNLFRSFPRFQILHCHNEVDAVSPFVAYAVLRST